MLKLFISLFCICFSMLSFSSLQSQETTALFIPPEGWKMAPKDTLPENIQALVIGSSNKSHYPPSINLACEPFKGNLKDYLKIVKTMNEKNHHLWKDLGAIRTEAGIGSLSQVDIHTEWGLVRMMHVILVKNHTAYILTAAALKEEFPLYYKDFFDSMRSIKITSKEE